MDNKELSHVSYVQQCVPVRTMDELTERFASKRKDRKATKSGSQKIDRVTDWVVRMLVVMKKKMYVAVFWCF